MYKKLLLIFPVIASIANAQCPVTISAANTVICQGTCVTLSAFGAQTYSWSANAGYVNSSTVNVCPSTTTTYTVYGVSGGSCLDSASITVYVSPNPTVMANANPSIICAGSTTTLSCMGASTYTWSPPSGLSSTTGAQVMGAPLSSTTYTMCGTSGGGCVNCATVAVTVNPSTTVSFSLTNPSPQVWDAVPNYSGGSPPYTYDWNWGDGSAHATTAYPSHTYTTAAWYNVCVTLTDANNCSSTYCHLDSLYKMNGSMISLNVISGTSGISNSILKASGFYPNPASDRLYIDVESGVADIFDLAGKLIFTRPITGKMVVDVSAFNEGIYILKIRTSEGLITKRLVIER